jgi:transcriptional regulator with XRE-family HTH domain
MIATKPARPGTAATMNDKNQAFFKTLGSRIAEARKERRLTQQQLADQLGIAQQTLAHYEVGRLGVGAAMLPRLAELLDLSLDEMLIGQPATRVPGRRGPPSQLAQQLDQLAQLPKARQKVVYDVLDMVLTKAQVEAGQAG